MTTTYYQTEYGIPGYSFQIFAFSNTCNPAVGPIPTAFAAVYSNTGLPGSPAHQAQITALCSPSPTGNIPTTIVGIPNTVVTWTGVIDTNDAAYTVISNGQRYNGSTTQTTQATQSFCQFIEELVPGIGTLTCGQSVVAGPTTLYTLIYGLTDDYQVSIIYMANTCQPTVPMQNLAIASIVPKNQRTYSVTFTRLCQGTYPVPGALSGVEVTWDGTLTNTGWTVTYQGKTYAGGALPPQTNYVCTDIEGFYPGVLSLQCGQSEQSNVITNNSISTGFWATFGKWILIGLGVLVAFIIVVMIIWAIGKHASSKSSSGPNIIISGVPSSVQPQ